MGKIGQTLEFEVVSRHETKRDRWVVLSFSLDAAHRLVPEAAAATHGCESALRLYIPADRPLPDVGERLRFVGGVGLDGCLTKAEPEEPIFVLLGRDPQAAAVVREWVRERLCANGIAVEGFDNVLADIVCAEIKDEPLREKLLEALRQADAMAAYAGGREAAP